jgi:hypothetical protein
MSKVKTLAILGVGYVLGAQAGRQRYEQLKRQAVKVAEHPRAQQFDAQARQTVATKLPPSVTSRLDKVTRPDATRTGTATAPTTAEPSVDVAADAGVQPAVPPSHL